MKICYNGHPLRHHLPTRCPPSKVFHVGTNKVFTVEYEKPEEDVAFLLASFLHPDSAKEEDRPLGTDNGAPVYHHHNPPDESAPANQIHEFCPYDEDKYRYFPTMITSDEVVRKVLAMIPKKDLYSSPRTLRLLNYEKLIKILPLELGHRSLVISPEGSLGFSHQIHHPAFFEIFCSASLDFVYSTIREDAEWWCQAMRLVSSGLHNNKKNSKRELTADDDDDAADDAADDDTHDGWHRQQQVFHWGRCHCHGHRQSWITKQQAVNSWTYPCPRESDFWPESDWGWESPGEESIRRVVVETGKTNKRWIREDDLASTGCWPPVTKSNKECVMRDLLGARTTHGQCSCGDSSSSKRSRIEDEGKKDDPAVPTPPPAPRPKSIPTAALKKEDPFPKIEDDGCRTDVSIPTSPKRVDAAPKREDGCLKIDASTGIRPDPPEVAIYYRKPPSPEDCMCIFCAAEKSGSAVAGTAGKIRFRWIRQDMLSTNAGPTLIHSLLEEPPRTPEEENDFLWQSTYNYWKFF